MSRVWAGMVFPMSGAVASWNNLQEVPHRRCTAETVGTAEDTATGIQCSAVSKMQGSFTIISCLLLYNTHTQMRLTALCPVLPRWAGTRKVKPIWILLKQETVSGSGISWSVCMFRLAADRKLCQQPTTEIFTGWLLYIIYKCARWTSKAEYEAGHIAILSMHCIDPWYNVAVYAVCLEICIVTSSADNIAVETSDV